MNGRIVALHSQMSELEVQMKVSEITMKQNTAELERLSLIEQELGRPFSSLSLQLNIQLYCLSSGEESVL